MDRKMISNETETRGQRERERERERERKRRSKGQGQVHFSKRVKMRKGASLSQKY